MARTMTAPWIKKSLQQLLFASGSNNKKSPEKITRICQVINTYESHRCIIISDKENCIPVFLTDVAIANLNEENISIKSLGNSIVKLETYHFSTIYQCAGDRNLPVIINDVSKPLAIQCSKLIFLGGDDSTTIGDPIHVNKELETEIRKFKYMEIIDKLRSKQFPRQNCLPDYDGNFTSFIVFSDDYPLTIEDCLISLGQFEFITALPSFTHSDLISAHTSRRHHVQRDSQLAHEMADSQGQLFDSQQFPNQRSINRSKKQSSEMNEIRRSDFTDSRENLTENDIDYSLDTLEKTMQSLKSAKEKKASRKRKANVDDMRLFTQPEDFSSTQEPLFEFSDELSQPGAESWNLDDLKFSQDVFAEIDNGILVQDGSNNNNNHSSSSNSSRVGEIHQRVAGQGKKDASSQNLGSGEDDLMNLLQPPSPHTNNIHNWVAARKSIEPALQAMPPSTVTHANESISNSSNRLVQPVATDTSASTATPTSLLWTLPSIGIIKGITNEGIIFESNSNHETSIITLSQLQSFFAALSSGAKTASAEQLPSSTSKSPDNQPAIATSSSYPDKPSKLSTDTRKETQNQSANRPRQSTAIASVLKNSPVKSRIAPASLPESAYSSMVAATEVPKAAATTTIVSATTSSSSKSTLSSSSPAKRALESAPLPVTTKKKAMSSSVAPPLASLEQVSSSSLTPSKHHVDLTAATASSVNDAVFPSTTTATSATDAPKKIKTFDFRKLMRKYNA